MSRNDVHGGDAAVIAARLGVADVPRVRADFSVNVNPLGPPDCVARALLQGDWVQHYPAPHADAAAEALAAAHGVDAGQVVVGNGSTELFCLLLAALQPARAAWLDPAYSGYAEVCAAAGVPGHGQVISATDPDVIAGLVEAVVAGAELVFLGHPNNPTGRLLPVADVLSFAAEYPAVTLVIDESFVDFVSPETGVSFLGAGQPGNVVVVKSLTKFFAIPGIRLGMLCAAPAVVDRIRGCALPWHVNGLAQQVARELYVDEDYACRTRAFILRSREAFAEALAAIPGVRVLPGVANFLLLHLPDTQTASATQAALLQQGYLVRSCTGFPGLGERWIRLAVLAPETNEALVAALRDPLEKKSNPEPRTQNTELRTQNREPEPQNLPARARALMVVGTMSHSGKTFLAAALCRWLARRGERVAPFKAQNMALNSFVTAEGGEMGRAQVVQAEAAGVAPHTDMNPVLLKPLHDCGSQVIVNGLAIGNHTPRSYYQMKTEMRRAAHEAYDRLAARYDWIVLEGAGSPAEINLLEEDFVNTDMGVYADARIVLVADIDRGGVFASIYGTLRLLPPAHRSYIAGVIINKFRGDPALLTSGIQQIEAMTGVPVLGVLPYRHDVQIDDEDSLGLDDRMAVAGGDDLDVVVIRLPRISNFTDFLPLEQTDGVVVRYLTDPALLGEPDVVIIPGSKDTRGDLDFLRDAGFDAALDRHVAAGRPLLGICGGYQMLGVRVVDPHGIEGTPGETIGLNLLPEVTVLEPHKALDQVHGQTTAGCPMWPAGLPVTGYEIHAGRTTSTGATQPLLRLNQRGNEEVSEPVGCRSEDGLVAGCYVHGLFDSDPLRCAFLDWLAARRGLAARDWPRGATDAFDLLADMLDEHLDLSPLGLPVTAID